MGRGIKAVLAKSLEAGRFYVLDRGYAKYKLLQQIIDAESNFACRINDDSVFEIIEERQLGAPNQPSRINRIVHILHLQRLSY